MQINPKKLNPLGFHLLKYLRIETFRFIILYGGSSSGKTFSVAQIILILTLWEGSNSLVMRKVGASIKDTVYQSFKSAADTLGVKDYFKFSDGVKTITCLLNDARIVFKGLDDSEKIKGLESFKRVIMEESSEFDEADHKQVRKRLRGMEGQQIIQMFNPINEGHWIKKKIFDTEKWHDVPMDVEIGGQPIPIELTTVKSIRINEPRVIKHKRTGELVEHPSDTVVIQTTYLNNFWVVGSPDGTYGYYDEQCIADFEKDRINDPDYYNVYALGEWGVIRTGSEFFSSFNRGKHTDVVKYNPEYPIHISVDSNVLPYISVTYWQIDTSNGHHLIQIGETCADSPNNTVRKSAKLVASRLKEFGVDKTYLHGDASTRSANNIDDEKRSFHDLFIDTLQNEGIEVEDCVSNKNPSVAMSGEFINAIFDGILPDIAITIGEDCNTSIEDYMMVQKDVNGAILKTKVKNKTTGQSYEEHGHLSDTFRYLCIDVLSEQFKSFANRRKRNLYAKDGFIQYFNPGADNKYSHDILYVIPNLGDKAVYVHGKLCGKKWHITEADIADTVSLSVLHDIIVGCNAREVIVECQDSYFPFIRTLRDELDDVKAKVIRGDMDKRIAATSDLVKELLLFDPDKIEDDSDYGAFLTNLLDFGSNSECIHAGAVISGFLEYVAKWMSNNI